MFYLLLWRQLSAQHIYDTASVNFENDLWCSAVMLIYSGINMSNLAMQRRIYISPINIRFLKGFHYGIYEFKIGRDP